MAVQYDGVLRTQNDNTNVTVTLGAGAPGSGIGVRVVIDDAVLTSREQVMLILKSIENAITKQTWPAA